MPVDKSFPACGRNGRARVAWVRGTRIPCVPDTLAGCRTVGGDWVYVVTDIESDGEVPGRNSMLTFASVAMSMNGQALGEFEAVLEPLPDASPNGETMAWWRTQPEAYSAATTNPESPVVVMRPFSSLWLLSPTGTGNGVPRTGLEPVACRLGGGRSIRLSYRGRTPTLLSQGLGTSALSPGLRSPAGTMT